MQSNSTLTYIFVSDRWGSGALKPQDLQYWQPLQFVLDSPTDYARF
jgi:hypothetical protein